MQLKLIREMYPNYTEGRLFINNEFYCLTVEDIVRIDNNNCEQKIKAQTAIPEGTYPIVFNFSNRFQKYMPLLLNVPCFEGIRIHRGQNPTHSEGCILIKGVKEINDLYSKMKKVEKKEKIFIEIVRKMGL